MKTCSAPALRSAAFWLGSIAVCLTRLTNPASAAEGFECREAVAQEVSSRLLDQVEKRYHELSTISADFVQSSLLAGLGKEEKSSGTVRFKKPGMMDWLYEKPEEQRFVADGKTLWFSQPSLRQVTVGDFQESFTSDLPVTFLLGLGRLQDSFSLNRACRTQDGTLLDLKPKSEGSNLEQFQLLIDNQSRSLGAQMSDIGGNQTSIRFLRMKFNEKRDDASFRFNIPKGYDVIDQRSAAGSGNDASTGTAVPFSENDLKSERSPKTGSSK